MMFMFQEFIRMNKILIIAILAVAFVSCEMESPADKEERLNLQEKQRDKHISGLVEEFRVVVIDSCEYVILNTNDEGYMAHKGNCSYCSKR